MKQVIGREVGSVLVSAILVLLMMTILGVGLTHSVSLRLKNSTSQGELNGAISAAESCVFEQVRWLTAQRRSPMGNGLNQLGINRADLQGLNTLTANIATAVAELDSGYSYQCNISSIRGRCTSSTTSGTGGNIGSTSSNNSRRICYQVNSSGVVGGRAAELIVTLSKGF